MASLLPILLSSLSRDGRQTEYLPISKVLVSVQTRRYSLPGQYDAMFTW